MTPLIVLTDSDTSTHSLEPPKKKTRKKRINEGASSRWSFGPHSACGSKESTAILITHSSFGSSSSDEDEIISDALSHQIQRCRDAEKQINRLRVAQLRRQRRLMAKNKKLQEKNLDLRRKLKQKSQNVHNQMCTICFDSFNDQGVKPASLSCGHTFCLKCAHGIFAVGIRGMESNGKCPNCRAVIYKKDIRQLYFS